MTNTIITIFAAVVGLCIGSFLNVVILRLPKEKSIVFPGSHCPKCKKPLRWHHNIPVLSFLALRGRCAYCKTKISWRYPLVEIITGALFVIVVNSAVSWIAWPFFAYFMCALVVSTFVDLDHWIIPDAVTLPGTAIGLVGSLVIPEQRFLFHLVGTLVGGGILFVFAWGYERLTKKEGLGGGDIKLLAMVGAFLGVQGAFSTLILSSVAGSVIGIFLILFKGKGGKTAIPFGPFLALGALLAFLFGDAFWEWYFHIGR